MTHNHTTTIRRIVTLSFAVLLAPLSRAEFLINEFLAENTGVSLTDEDNFPADWIEIHNPGPAASINGYHLTDDATNLTKWTFPNVTIPSNGYLIVFATGKNRATAGQPLHTNFSLDRGGEFLALVKPDGTSTVSLFSPAYPEQYPDVSYGNATGGPALNTTLHAVGDPLTYLVPTEDIGSSWQTPAYDDSSWVSAHSAVGWGYNPPVGDTIAPDGNLTSTMRGKNASVYLRLPFEINAPDGVNSMALKVKMDDGFVAYLNGEEVASKNKPSPLVFDSESTKSEEVQPEDEFEVFPLDFSGHLVAGENILALHGLNDSPGSSDFILITELIAEVQDTASLPGPAHMANPTPNGVNGIPSFPPPGKVEFDVTSKAFTGTIDLSLSVADPGAVIYYTTDGSLPTNDTNGPSPVYNGPISIDGTTLVRARAYLPGSLPGEGRTEGYFLLDPSSVGFTSNLPIILLSTYGGGAPPSTDSTTRKESFMLIYEPDPVTGRASITDTPVISTRSGIRKRGSSSGNWPKYGMSMETWDEFNEDRDIEPLGLDPEADWILNSRYQFDYSLMRNPFLYALSNQIGQWAVKTRFVELFNDVNGGDIVYNSDYFGVYCLMEKIEPDNNRLDIAKLDPWENTPEEITGGYVFKNDRADPGEPTFSVSGFQRALVHGDPDGLEITSTQKSYLTTHCNQVTTALRAANGINPTTGLHYSDYLDVDSFVDHFWLNILAMDPDWGRLSQYFHKDRGGKIVAGPIWDYDRTMGSRDGRDDNPLRWEAPTTDTSFTWFDREYEWFGLLFGFTTAHDQYPNMPNPQLITGRPDVFQKLIDRWYELRRNEFAQSNLEAIIDGMAAELSEAQARNFARWGLDANSIQGINYATEGTGWARQVSHLKGWLKARSEWIDGQFFSPPTFSQNGGTAPVGFQLTMSTSQGNVYYTTDGSDPRAPGGSPAAGATTGTMVTLNETTTVTARAYNGSQWGAPTIATFVIGADLADPTNLVVSEIMYQPSEPTQAEIDAGFINNNQFEYLELMNISGNTVDLTNVTFTDGVDFTFAGAAVTALAPGARVLIVRDQAAFEFRYGTDHSDLIAGEFANDTGLAGNGEQIILMGFGGDIRNFTYNDKYPWPETPDGDGPSLVLIAPVSNPNHDDAINWRASVGLAGAAGISDATAFTGDPNADNDKDGLNAFAEYAYGTSDLVFGGQIVTSGVDANGRFTISYPRNLAADDALIVVEVSTDMETWTQAGAALEHDEEVHNGDGTSTLTLRTPAAAEGAPKFFVRLRVYER